MCVYVVDNGLLCCIANGLSIESGFSVIVTVNTAETLCKVTLSDTTEGFVEIGQYRELLILEAGTVNKAENENE